jgi:hypothetical protein
MAVALELGEGGWLSFGTSLILNAAPVSINSFQIDKFISGSKSDEDGKVLGPL